MITARPLPQPLSIEWRGWPQAGRGPTGRAKLLLSPIQSPVARSVGQCSRPENSGGLAAGEFHCQFKSLTVRDLIRGWVVTACDFHDARLEWRTGGNDRPAIESKQRLDRGKRRQRRVSPAIRFWVTRVTGRCRPATRRAERGASRDRIKARLLKGTASIFRSAGRRPARASRPCHPFSLNTFNRKSLHQIMSNFSL
jgi:hypothetical protein